MPESFFSYNLTRPYPYRWFTWATVIGGLAATALFSIINLAADGYNLITVFSIDPNATVTEARWFQKSPWSLTSKLATSCQPEIFAVGSQVQTNAGGIFYTLSKVMSPDYTNQATLPYLNNVIKDCQLSTIQLVWGNESAGYFTSGDSFTVSASMTCNVTSETEYSIGLDIDIESEEAFPYSDPTQGSSPFEPEGAYIVYDLVSASLNNFEGLLNGSSLSLYDNIAQLTIGGTINNDDDLLNPNNVDDMLKLDYFALSNSLIYLNHTTDDDAQLEIPSTDVVQDAAQMIFKLVLSAIQTDLGQNNSNLFTQPSVLVQFLRQSNLPSDYDIPPPGVNITKFYWNETAPLPTINPTAFATRYLCQVPQLKSTGSLVISILVADLVFLQALWKVFNWLVTSTLEHKQPEAKFCQGCATEYRGDYSSINQTDSAGRVEGGKGPGAQISAAASRRESITGDEMTPRLPARAATA